MTKFLASVRNLDEARLAVDGGADIIDLKAPDRGSLGALPADVVRSIVAALRGVKPISATVGDLPMQPARVGAAVAAALETGVDYVKVGMFPGGNSPETLRDLQAFTRSGFRLVAVLFADRDPLSVSPCELRDAGFVGCMLDTLDKDRGSLTEVCTVSFLRDFIATVRETGMFSGLAGSLAAGDVPALRLLKPDYLGFRGALCRDHYRTGQLDGNYVQRIAALLNADAPSESETVSVESADRPRQRGSEKALRIA